VSEMGRLGYALSKHVAISFLPVSYETQYKGMDMKEHGRIRI